MMKEYGRNCKLKHIGVLETFESGGKVWAISNFHDKKSAHKENGVKSSTANDRMGCAMDIIYVLCIQYKLYKIHVKYTHCI